MKEEKEIRATGAGMSASYIQYDVKIRNVPPFCDLLRVVLPRHGSCERDLRVQDGL